jgi:hypothetical protein
VKVPTIAVDVRERAVLMDQELVTHLALDSPTRGTSSPSFSGTMACVSRMLGGVRTGGLHTLRWDSFNTTEGAFRFGSAPRKKTACPQLLEVP